MQWTEITKQEKLLKAKTIETELPLLTNSTCYF